MGNDGDSSKSYIAKGKGGPTFANKLNRKLPKLTRRILLIIL